MKSSCCLLPLSQHLAPGRSPLIPDPAHLLAFDVLWANSAHQPAVLLLSDGVSLWVSACPQGNMSSTNMIAHATSQHMFEV